MVNKQSQRSVKTIKKVLRLQLNIVENAKTFHCIEFLKKVEEIKIFEILYQVQLKAYNSVALFNYRLFYSPLKSAKLFKMGHSNQDI